MAKRTPPLKMLSFVLAGALIGCLLLKPASTVVLAEEQKSSSQIKSEINNLKNKKEEIDKQITDLEGQIAENDGKIENLIQNKNVIEQELFLLRENINNINSQIISHGLLIAEQQEKLVEAQTALELLNQKNKARIQAMEENESLSYWSVLFRANSFSDLLDRIVMIDDIASSDKRRLDELRDASNKVEQAKTKLETEKADLERTYADLDLAKADAEAKQAESDAILTELLATGVEYQTLLGESAEKTEALMNEISALDAQFDEAKEREYQEWLAQQKPVTPPAPPASDNPAPPTEPTSPPSVDGVSWIVPVNYTMVSSPFGYRLHPIYNTWRLHAGIDLAAPTGAPIIASRGGVVTTASYEAGGAGYYVCINHMDGYSTRYMHMTHFIVSSGQKVQAGEVIGYVGSTGASTGPHLHFGVYYNGTPINPAPFIGIS